MHIIFSLIFFLIFYNLKPLLKKRHSYLLLLIKQEKFVETQAQKLLGWEKLDSLP